MASVQLKPIRGQRKARQIKQVMRKLAMELGPRARLPTVRDLCDSLDVAKVTLDTALLDLENEGVVDRCHGSGLFVSSRVNQKKIGLVFGRDVFEVGVSPVCRILLQRCQERAGKKDEHFSFYLDLPGLRRESEPAPAHRDLVDDLRAGRLDGLLLVWRRDQNQERWLRRQGIPVVSFVTGEIAAPGTVHLDYGKMASMGVEALAARGCRKIGLVTPLGDARPYAADRVGFEAALRRLGLTTRPEWIWERPKERRETHVGDETREEQGRRIFLEIFARASDASASRLGMLEGVVVLDDMLTRGGLAALQQMGLHPGRDLHIATHANQGSPVLKGYEDFLARIEVNPDQIVEDMFEMLEQLMTADASVSEVTHVLPVIKMGPRC